MSHLHNAFHEEHLAIFLDESGKGLDRPNLIGTLSIPNSLYQSDDFQHLNYYLQRKLVKFHWKRYNGNQKVKDNILELINIILEYEEFIKFNVINYHSGFLNSPPYFTEEDRITTIYSKFPERLIYGMIRGYGKEMSIRSDIYIDYATEYEKIYLDKTLPQTLNSHSLYRGERFYTKSCTMYKKNCEIGLEITDILLGMLRTIILNEQIEANSSVIKQQKNLVIYELLMNPTFKRFLSNIRYYEWHGTKTLCFVSFTDYIHAFMLKNKFGYIGSKFKSTEDDRQ